MWGLLVVAGRQLSRRYRSLLLLLACALIYAHVVTNMVRSGGSTIPAALDLNALPPSASSHALDLYPDQGTRRLDLGGDDWTVRSEDGMAGPAVAAVVPGGVYSDLQAAGKLGDKDIYYRYNDDDFGWVADTNWVYEKTFFVPESFRSYQRVVLNFEGVDTVADVLLNNRNIGNTENMFVRYRFDVKEHLKFGEVNYLVVAFESPVKYATREFEHHKHNRYIVPVETLPDYLHAYNHRCFIRKMQCSFGWDVTPAYPSSGIYKPVFLEAFNSAAVRYIKFISRQGHKGWTVAITTVLDAPTNFRGNLKVNLRNATHLLINKSYQVKADMIQAVDGGVAVTVEEALPLNTVAMWWPNGMDKHRALYDLTVSTEGPKSREESSKKTVRVGFRMISVLQPSIKEVVGDPEAEGAGFHFRVNGQAVFAKGASLAPVHMLPEKATKRMVDTLLEFAANSHMNMIRVWGQGMYESDYLYARADELGLMIWQDFSFGNTMYPATTSFLQNVEKEALHQVRRLQHHPSLAMLCGNNENEKALSDNQFNTYHVNKTEAEILDSYANIDQYYSDYLSLYVDTLKRVSSSEAPSTPFLTSTPSDGEQSANQGHVSDTAGGETFGTMHYYDRKSNMWIAAHQPVPRFMAEYGFQSFPSVATMRKYTVDEDLYWTSRFINHRQHGTNANDALIKVVSTHFDIDSEVHSRDMDGLSRLFYLAQVNQAQSLRVATEHLRRSQSFTTEDYRGLTMGALYWQLNSVWPGADLSPLEFGGKWKLAAYQVEPMFRPLIISVAEMTEGSIDIFVINSGRAPQTGLRVRLIVHKYADSKACSEGTFETEITAEPGGTIAFMTLPVSKILDRCKFREYEYLEELVAERERGGKGAGRNVTTMSDTEKAPQAEDVSMPIHGEWRRYAAFLVFQLLDSNGTIASETHRLLCEPKHAVGLSDPEIRATVTKTGPSTFELKFRAKRAALFVYLEYPDAESATARFSDNGFLMWGGGAKTVIMEVVAGGDISEERVRNGLIVMSYYPQRSDSNQNTP